MQALSKGPSFSPLVQEEDHDADEHQRDGAGQHDEPRDPREGIAQRVEAAFVVLRLGGQLHLDGRGEWAAAHGVDGRDGDGVDLERDIYEFKEGRYISIFTLDGRSPIIKIIQPPLNLNNVLLT